MGLPIKTFQMRMWQYLLVVLSLMAFQQVTEGREQPARLSTRPACTYRPKFFDGENKCYKKGGVCNVNLRKNCKAAHCVDKCCKGLKCSKKMWILRMRNDKHRTPNTKHTGMK